MKQTVAVSVLLMLCMNLIAQEKDFRYAEDWESIRSHYKVPEWFRDAKFGIFVIWGPYAVPAFGSEKYSKLMYMPGNAKRDGLNYYEHHRQTYGDQSEFGYKDFLPMFKGEKFDADEWVSLFKKAGARYVVPIAEYHDGYAMYDSKHTRWDAVETGPGKDIIGLLGEATRNAGLKYGVSSHLANWKGWYSKKDPSWDTNDPEYRDLYRAPTEPGSKPSKEFLKTWWDRTTDIIDNYKPDLLWFDFVLDRPGYESLHKPILAYYYNKGLEWNKGVVFQDKNMKYKRFPEDLIVLDIERGRMDSTYKYPWQTDTSVGLKSWGYIEDEDYKSSDYLIDELIDIVSKNGCLLLAIGPKADGTIAAEQESILTDIGEWLSINGEAIYGTRPWKIHGEGPTKVSSGHHSEHENKDHVAADIRFTTKRDTLYATSLDWPEVGIFNITSLAADNPFASHAVRSVEFISGPNQIYWKQTSEGLMIFTKGEKSCEAAYSFRILFYDDDNPNPRRRRYRGLFTRRPMAVERYRPPEWEDLVFGGQFMDRFETMPVMGELTTDTWGGDGVVPRYADNGLEDPEWTYWGGNAVKGKDGRYHLITNRWPERAPHGHWHYHQSLVVHAISENPFGPYTVDRTLFPGHNPQIWQLKDGRYFIKSGQTLWVENRDPAQDAPVVLEPIEGLADHWELVPLKVIDRERRSKESGPMAMTGREDGSWIGLTRHGDIWISRTGLSPWHRITDQRVYPDIEARFEDPAIWRTNVQYHLVTHDWQGRIAYHMRSKDGIHWKLEDGVAYESGKGLTRYEDGTVEDWHKYEVIRINQDEHGRAVRATFAAIDSHKAEDLGSDNHNSKNLVLQLTPGKLLNVLNNETISAVTDEIHVKILAEEGFNPHTDIDLSSLRFGISEEVNFGRGCRLKKTKKSGNDLVLIFEGTGNNFNAEHFAGKLLGKTADGKLLFGYSRLPGISYLQPALSSLPARFRPFDGGVDIEVEVQNFGQVSSVETPVRVMMREGFGNLYEVHGTVPPLEPYAKTIVKFKRTVDTWKPGRGSTFNVTVEISPPGQPKERISRETVVIP